MRAKAGVAMFAAKTSAEIRPQTETTLVCRSLLAPSISSQENGEATNIEMKKCDKKAAKRNLDICS
jgi:hypothetical protein